ncbi:MAG TPA: hypothetical protein VJT09_06120 [Pyrinomonadaceae bacterium]|nr:hypothetical protein [Pyrinomonadaceae bacterium]
MRKLALVALLLAAASAVAVAQTPARQDYGLPDLHVIRTITLAPSYSCRSQEEFQKGYEQSALFLSSYSKRSNSPDLLFNGACKGTDYFQASTGGDDMALIADLGTDVSVENLTAHQVFNKRGVHNFDDYSKFARSVKVEANHTYVVLLSKHELRGLYIFTVAEHVPNERVSLRYAVKEYQIMEVRAQSSGFSWGQPSAAIASEAVEQRARKQN